MGKFLCFVVFVIGAIIMTSSFPPAYAEVMNGKAIDHVNIGTQANQIKFLIGGVILLIGGNMWWFRRFVVKSETKDEDQDEEIQETKTTLNTLKTQHEMCMEMGPCSRSNPDNLKEAITEALQPLFNRFHEQQRTIEE